VERGAVTPAAQRDLVRRGYDAISVAYRSDEGSPADSSSEDAGRYAGWVDVLIVAIALAASALALWGHQVGVGLVRCRVLTAAG
jgi:hypothetical protein